MHKSCKYCNVFDKIVEDSVCACKHNIEISYNGHICNTTNL